MKTILYSKNKPNYRYRTESNFLINIDIKNHLLRAPATHAFVNLLENGDLVIIKGYAWDGASGPAINTVSFVRPSLVHDALYQLMREGGLGQEHRAYADDLLYKMCIEDGMSKFRAWYVRKAVQVFGGPGAKPSNKKILSAPCWNLL